MKFVSSNEKKPPDQKKLEDCQRLFDAIISSIRVAVSTNQSDRTGQSESESGDTNSSDVTPTTEQSAQMLQDTFRWDFVNGYKGHFKEKINGKIIIPDTKKANKEILKELLLVIIRKYYLLLLSYKPAIDEDHQIIPEYLLQKAWLENIFIPKEYSRATLDSVLQNLLKELIQEGQITRVSIGKKKRITLPSNKVQRNEIILLHQHP